MSRSSEEVLLIVNHIRHKKTDGTLYLMGQRIAWMPGGKDTFTVSHNYADIRTQKISPDSKEKVQLQVVLHSGSADTFQFANPLSRPNQVQDREGVKELLQQLLPKFRRKVNSELEEKNRMLQEDPEMFQLYKDLVVSGIVSAEEFWASRVNKATNNNKVQQEVGVSAAFLADIKPQTDGCNGLKYNLTPDIIESIFRTYPAVRKKHAETVPDKLSEAEFWTKFFQSHYFHRDRINFSSKDLFADCVKNDDEEIKQATQSPVLDDTLVNLTNMSDSLQGDGYGVDNSSREAAGSNLANSSLIKRFNQHSTMVLKTALASSSSSSSSASSSSPATTNGTSHPPAAATASSSSHNSSASGEPNAKKAKLLEQLEYNDLEKDKVQTTAPALKLTKMERYLHGPTPITSTSYNTTQDIMHACHVVAQEMQGYTPRLDQALNPSLAISILGELSPGGRLMQGYTNQELHQMVPQDLQQEIKNLYGALCELLRHFWACFPVTSPQLEEKLARMKTNLDRFQVAKLNPLKDRIHSHHYSVNLVGHLEEMLFAAYNKYTLWVQKRKSRKT